MTRKLLILATLCLAIFCYANLAHATVVWDTTGQVATSGPDVNIFTGWYWSLNVSSTASANVTNGTPLYIAYWLNTNNGGFASSYYVSPWGSAQNYCTSGCYLTIPYAGNPTGLVTSTITVVGNITSGVDTFQMGNAHGSSYPAPTSFAGGYTYQPSCGSQCQQNFQPWVCVTTDPTFSDCAFMSGGYVPPTVSFYFPTQSTTTPDFSTWELSLSNVTTTDEYESKVFYSPLGSSITYFDQNLFYPNFPSGVNPLNKSVSLASLTTTTAWSAYAYLYDVSEGNVLVATSSAITFNVTSATSTYTGIYSSSTFPTPYPVGTLASTSPAFATSTCNWGDVGCAIGNITDNVLNFIFGINDAEIQVVAGFNLVNEQPFALVPQIQNIFASAASSPDAAFATSSLEMNLGNGIHQIPWFSAAIVKMFIPSSLASFIRSLILSFLILLLIYGFYIEIKHIFKPHA